jgi:hypothetical protein
MSRTIWQPVLIVAVMVLFVSAAGVAQEPKTVSPPVADSESGKTVKPAARLPLQSVTLVSTEEAARKAAEEMGSKAQTSKTPPTKELEAGKAPDGAVLEFHPTDNLPGKDAVRGGFQQKEQSKSVLKNVHGSAYGAAASAAGRAHGEGGDVGAQSRGGKLNIYLEGERTHASTPVPH